MASSSDTDNITRTAVNRVVRAARRIDSSEPDSGQGRDRTQPAATVDVPEQAARLRLAITRTARRMRQSAGATELGVSSVAALATIERAGPLTPSGLAEAEQIKRPTATKVIERLESRGYVERSADPDDGRCSLITITTSGKDPLKRLRRRKDAYLARRLENLPERDVATLRRASAILERMLEEERS